MSTKSKNTVDSPIIKSRERVKQHGEVFTPQEIVNQMINLPGLNDDITNPLKKVLEPACGEGIFLTSILKRRLDFLTMHYCKQFKQYEELSLLSLTTLYGIELLRDNREKCFENMENVFMDYYSKIAHENNQLIDLDVINSAKHIIMNNIVQGNFLTGTDNKDRPIIFNEWEIVPTEYDENNLPNAPIQIQRIEHFFDDIANKGDGTYLTTYKPIETYVNSSLFPGTDYELKEDMEEPSKKKKISKRKYKPCFIRHLHQLKGYEL